MNASMNKRVPSKVVRISFVVAFAVQSIFCCLSGDEPAPVTLKKSSEHFFRLTDEGTEYSSKGVRDAIKGSPGLESKEPSKFANPEPGQTDNNEWGNEWDIGLEELNDLQTFFPIEEESCAKDNDCIEPKKQTGKSNSKPKAAARVVNHLYSLGKEDGADASQATQSIQGNNSSTTFFDSDQEDWELHDFQPRKPADISTAETRNAGLLSIETKGKVDFDAFSPQEIEDAKKLSTNIPQEPPSLGKARVAVPPFTLGGDAKESSKESKQTFCSQRSPAPKLQASSPRQGLFGPFRPASSLISQEKAKPRDAIELETAKDKSRRQPEQIIAQVVEDTNPVPEGNGQFKTPPKTILINFNNVSVIEYIRFISRLTNKNFIFDQNDLQFNVTIISEEATTLENVMTALIQELRIHGLSLIEEGNNLIIHQNKEVRGISRVNVEGVAPLSTETELVTQLFRLNTLDPEHAKAIISPLLSNNALIETAIETRHLIITDLVVNIKKVDTLLKSIDAPNSGLVIGQYVVRNAFMDNLIDLAKQIMLPIAQDQALSFVPHPAAKSIFIVSSPFIVERTISVLQHLDNFEGTTRIYDLEDLKFHPITPTFTPPSVGKEAAIPGGLLPQGALVPSPGGTLKPPLPVEKTPVEPPPPGKWELTPGGAGGFIFRPGFKPGGTLRPTELPQGNWLLDPQGNWFFQAEGTLLPFKKSQAKPVSPGDSPKGRWSLDPQGSWVFQLTPGEQLQPERLTRGQKIEEELPVGHIERTKFFIQKLQFRRGEDIVKALQSIAESLQAQGATNADLIATILSAQWLETSNAIIITGTDSSIPKVRELIDEIDRPQRQVLIEMLILETTIDDSLTYGVSWGTKSGGGNTSTAQAFIGGASPLVSALASTGITGGAALIPDASGVATSLGYHLGVVGQRLTHNGTQFASLGALVTAIHTRADSNIVLSPKIITEDNKTAEIFVGVNTPFLSNSIANDQGSVITTNVEFRDTGTTLKVTPLIGYGNIITLEIEQEVSRTSNATASGSSTTNVNLTPTTSINRTTTTIHIPDRHFAVISGMIQDEQVENRNNFPCLGGIPVIGAAFSVKDKTYAKRNLMIFIRPEIVDTEEQLRKVTRREQEIMKQKSRMKKSWKYEVDEALDFMNIKNNCCDECE